MRHMIISTGLMTLLLTIVGCDWLQRREQVHGSGQVPHELPSAESLVGYLNRNAALIQTLKCNDVDLVVSRGIQSFGLNAQMAYQAPSAPGNASNFRLQAATLGKDEADIGSNAQEFWYWIARSEPPFVFHCSYQDFRHRRINNMPLPFQPEWIVEALGAATYDPAGKYKVRANKDILELIQETRSPQGQQVWKITAFRWTKSADDRPQVIGHVLLDRTGKEICAAYVNNIMMDQNSGAVIPRGITFNWPEQRMKLKLTLTDVVVNTPIDAGLASSLFSRQKLAQLPGYDLANGRPDQSADRVQRTGGRFFR